MEMHLKVCFSILVFLSTAGASFSVKPDSQLTTCNGSDLLLDWTINDGSDISIVVWAFKGTNFATKSGINGAVTYIGSITATDVEHTTSGKIKIKNSAVADAGEYACSITYQGTSGIAPDSSTATVAVVIAPSDPTCTHTGNTYTCATDSTSATVTIKVDNVDKGTTTYTGSVESSVECCLSGDAVQCRSDTSGTEYCKVLYTGTPPPNTTTTTTTTTTTKTPTTTTTQAPTTTTTTPTPPTTTSTTSTTTGSSSSTVNRTDSQTKALIIALPTVFGSIIIIAAVAFGIIWFRKHYMNKKPKSTVKVKLHHSNIPQGQGRGQGHKYEYDNDRRLRNEDRSGHPYTPRALSSMGYDSSPQAGYYDPRTTSMYSMTAVPSTASEQWTRHGDTQSSNFQKYSGRKWQNVSPAYYYYNSNPEDQYQIARAGRSTSAGRGTQAATPTDRNYSWDSYDQGRRYNSGGYYW